MISFFAFLHLGGDAALWLVWASVILSLFTPLADRMLFAGAIGLGAWLADLAGSRYKPLRWLGLLPAALFLSRCRGLGDWLLCGPPAAYLLITIARDTLQPNATELYYRFRTRAWLTLLGGLFCVMAGRVWAFQCAVMSLAASVFLMRMLRHSSADHRNFRLAGMEIAMLLAVWLICLLLSWEAVLSAAIALLKQIYFLLLYPIIMLALYLILAVMRLLEWIVSIFWSGEFEMPNMQGMQMALGEAEQMMAVEEGTGHPLLVLFIRLFAVLIFLSVAFGLFFWLHRASGERIRGGKSEQERRQNLDPREETFPDRPGLLDRTPQAKIRRSYASFCKTVSREKKRIAPSHTTRAVNVLADLERSVDAAQLRQLYLRARYAADSTLTQEDARTAAALSKKLRSELE